MKIEKIVEGYAEQTPIRILTTTLIPVFGSIIDQILGNYANNMYQKRIEDALRKLDNELLHIKNKLVTNDFLKSESFFDIFIQFLENSIKTRNEEKIQYYVKILSDTISHPDKIEFNELVMRQIALLTTNDLILMRFMYKKNQENPELFGNPNTIEGGFLIKNIPNNTPTHEDISQLTNIEIKISLNTITATGFVKEFSGAAGAYKGEWYYITPLLIETMNSLGK